MSEKLMTAKEAAEYLSLNEKKIYALAKSGDIPCTKVTGKWIFPRERIDSWIEESIRPAASGQAYEHIKIVGSHDPAIDLLASEMNGRFPRITILAAHVGSLAGLEALSRGAAHISGIHLLDPETNEYNITYAERYVGALHPLVVHFLDREQGLMVQRGNPMRIESIEDLTRGGIRLINRQRGSGTRMLLDLHLAKLGIDPGGITGYEDCASTHTEVATVVRGDGADAGLGLRAAATAADLDFITIAKERYDLVIPRAFFYTEPIQKGLEVIRSKRFKERVERLSGYDTTDAGAVLAW
jgi:putative molybdopterin biosynthesis protein